MTIPIDPRKFSEAVSSGGKLAAPRTKNAGGPGFCVKAAACLLGAALAVVLPALGRSYEHLAVIIALAFWGFCIWKERN